MAGQDEKLDRRHEGEAYWQITNEKKLSGAVPRLLNRGSLSVKTAIRSRDCLGRKVGLISVRLPSVLFLEWRCSVNANNACGSGCSQVGGVALNKGNRKGAFVVPEFPTPAGTGNSVAPLLGRRGWWWREEQKADKLK